MALYKNIRARDLLELFLISAASSVLLVRFYLHLAGYPQLGGGGFHIAHMLWGGLLMLISIVAALAFFGSKSQLFAAIVGGFGFGIFIDEIGKFITSDNDYFYQPAVGIIYAIFAILYLTFSYLTRNMTLSSREYQLNALAGLEEALSHDMDEAEKANARMMLDRADQGSYITIELKKLFDNLETVPVPSPGRFGRMISSIDNLYQDFWNRRESNGMVRAFFILEAAIIIFGVLGVFATNIDDLLRVVGGQSDYGALLLMCELAAAFVASLLAIQGAFMLGRSRLEAFERFRLATLINLLLTDFFRFTRLEFAALPNFFFNLALIVIVSYAIRQERRMAEALRDR